VVERSAAGRSRGRGSEAPSSDRQPEGVGFVFDRAAEADFRATGGGCDSPDSVDEVGRAPVAAVIELQAGLVNV